MPQLIRQDDWRLHITKDVNDIRSALRRVVANLPLYDISNENTPGTILADQNDYVPGNFDVLRLSSDAARTITGISGGVKGRFLHIFNVGDYAITLAYESTSSQIANRFKFSNGISAFIAPGANMRIYYSIAQQRWVGGGDRGAFSIVDDQYVNFEPNQTFAGNWEDVTGAVLTLTTTVRCTIDVDAIVTGYNTLAGAGRGFYYRAMVGGVADPATNFPYMGSESPTRNQTLAYKYRVSGMASGLIEVKLQCQADSGINEPNFVTRGRLLARALAEG